MEESPFVAVNAILRKKPSRGLSMSSFRVKDQEKSGMALIQACSSCLRVGMGACSCFLREKLQNVFCIGYSSCRFLRAAVSSLRISCPRYSASRGLVFGERRRFISSARRCS